ncbi:MAG: hypothetical protein Q8N56_01480 [bacterium]|nr:hypothetical protein [bacterium]
MPTLGYLLIAACVICIWIGRKSGRDAGYSIGYHHGYKQCCEDYDLYKKEGIDRLSFFQERSFEIKEGIHEAREFEKELKGKGRGRQE